MKVVIVNCFDTYEDRVDLLYEFFNKKGHEVKVIQSDFRHFKKKYRNEHKEGFIFVKSKSYFKNLSLRRLISHYKFAKDAFKIVKEIKPDLLYTFIPPNSVTKFASQYKRKHTEVKLVLDLIDLWPETMPIEKVKNTPPFAYWRNLRDKSIKTADFVVTECELYRDVLNDVLEDVKSETVYLAKKNIEVIRTPQLSEEEISLVYLGSINNIIDIPKIKEIIKIIKVSKPVTLHIIGDGESKQELIESATASGANVHFHGKIYDPQEKQDIFDKCHFGLNIMKDSVCVGLTMKSIDYFQFGIPILNNIPADTSSFVTDYKVGINIGNLDKDYIHQLKSVIEEVNQRQLYDMRKQALLLFQDKFSHQAFLDQLNLIDLFS